MNNRAGNARKEPPNFTQPAQLEVPPPSPKEEGGGNSSAIIRRTGAVEQVIVFNAVDRVRAVVVGEGENKLPEEPAASYASFNMSASGL